MQTQSKPKRVHTHAAHIKPPTTDTPKPRPREKAAYPDMPKDRAAYCRLPQMIGFSGFGRSRLYTLMAEGKLPRPIKVGRSSVWQVGKFLDAMEKLAEEGQSER